VLLIPTFLCHDHCPSSDVVLPPCLGFPRAFEPLIYQHPSTGVLTSPGIKAYHPPDQPPIVVPCLSAHIIVYCGCRPQLYQHPTSAMCPRIHLVSSHCYRGPRFLPPIQQSPFSMDLVVPCHLRGGYTRWLWSHIWFSRYEGMFYIQAIFCYVYSHLILQTVSTAYFGDAFSPMITAHQCLIDTGVLLSSRPSRLFPLPLCSSTSLSPSYSSLPFLQALLYHVACCGYTVSGPHSTALLDHRRRSP